MQPAKTRALLLWIAIISLPVSLISGSVLAMFWSSRGETRRVRDQMALFLARQIESEPYPISIPRWHSLERDSGPRSFSLWIIDDTDRILISNSPEPPPPEWATLAKPKAVHQVNEIESPLLATPQLMMIRLNDPAGRHLLIVPDPHAPMRDSTFQLIKIFVLFCISTLLFLSSVLLRKKFQKRSQ